MARIHILAGAASVALMTMGIGAAQAQTAPQVVAPPAVWVRSIPVDLAIEGAKAALAACRGKHASVGVVDHDGHMIVEFVEDYATMIGQKALPEKLHAAVIRQSSTQQIADNSKGGKLAPEVDWEAKIIDRFNEGALISPGAIPLFIGSGPSRQFVGALGVAGASPPGAGVGTVDDDEMCARAGVAAIADRLK